MSDLKDFNFDSKSKPGDFETGPVEETDDNHSKRKSGWSLVALIAVVVALAVATVLWLRRPDEEVAVPPAQASEAPTAPTTEAASAEPEPTLELPELNASDLIVRELVGALSAHPNLLTWLASDDLLRLFAASIVNIAEGETPKTHLAVLGSSEPFSVVDSAAGVHPTDKSYARYDTVAEVFTSLDVVGTVKLYHQVRPLLDEAFLELGYPGEEFHGKLVAALDHLLATPVVEPDVALKETVAAYEFADADLEALSAVQKQLLRMGPDNVQKVQAQLGALRRELLAGDEG